MAITLECGLSDGHRVVSRSNDKTVRIRDCRTGNEVALYQDLRDVKYIEVEACSNDASLSSQCEFTPPRSDGTSSIKMVVAAAKKKHETYCEITSPKKKPPKSRFWTHKCYQAQYSTSSPHSCMTHDLIPYSVFLKLTFQSRHGSFCKELLFYREALAAGE